MAELQTVTFQAAKTNSTPPPLPEKKKRGNDGPLLIAIFNGLGIGWLLWDHRAIALLVAACVFGISIAMRKNHWLPDISWILSCVVVCALLIAPPTLPTKTWQAAHRSTDLLAKELRGASIACERTGTIRDCGRRQALVFEMGDARRIEDRAKEIPATAPIDLVQGVILYLLAAGVLYICHRIAGQPDEVAPQVPPPPPQKTEDPEEASRKKGFNAWLASDRVIVSDKDQTTPVDKVFDSYKRFLGDMTFPPPREAYFDLSGFKEAFKTIAQKEPIDVKGEPHYKGVTIA